MWERRIRLWSGLLVALFVIPHIINHALGLVSFEAMEAMRKVLSAIWAGPLGGPILLLAFLVHFVFSLHALFKRSTLRMPPWEAAQIALGIAIFPLILTHIAGTAVAGQMLGFDPTYEYVIAALWVSAPAKGIQQTVVLIVVWGHLCVGLHFWLRLKSWYPRWIPVLYGAALLIPVMSLLGFARIGRELAARHAANSGYLAKVFAPVSTGDQQMVSMILSVEPNGWIVFAMLLVFVIAARIIRRIYRNRHGVYHITDDHGRSVAAPVGTTILDALRDAGIPHASVCGGRGRCTTCRVHVGDAAPNLPPPGEVERRALTRIGAEPEVRLACQLQPRDDVAIKPLLPPNATARDANRPGGIQGREQEVATMFIDLRGSTKLGEDKLPYDILFILNQYFAEMSAALNETDGHYAQFSGDGLMALYGLKGSIEAGCRDAIKCAVTMANKLDELNERLKRELKEPLQMGVGIHCGEAIVGTMGPPTAQNFSAIGDNINIAARLESLTKEFGCFLVVSENAVTKAGIDLSDYPQRQADVRGRDESIAVYAVEDPRAIAALNEI